MILLLFFLCKVAGHDKDVCLLSATSLSLVPPSLCPLSSNTDGLAVRGVCLLAVSNKWTQSHSSHQNICVLSKWKLRRWTGGGEGDHYSMVIRNSRTNWSVTLPASRKWGTEAGQFCRQEWQNPKEEERVVLIYAHPLYYTFFYEFQFS